MIHHISIDARDPLRVAVLKFIINRFFWSQGQSFRQEQLRLIVWWPFNLDHITLWICDIDRITVALGT